MDQMVYEPPKTIGAALSRRMTPLMARRSLKFDIDRPVVSFTFDDVPRSIMQHALPALQAVDWRATVYVSCGLMDVENHHGRMISAADLQAIHDNGHEIGGHTYSHLDIGSHDPDHIWADIKRNQAALAELGIPACQHFAFPFGEIKPEMKHQLGTRFSSLRGIKPGAHLGRADLNQLRCSPIYDSPRTINRTLKSINDLAHRPGWLTLFTHDVRPGPSRWGCTPETFAAVVDAVKSIDAIVLPIGGAVDYLKGSSCQT